PQRIPTPEAPIRHPAATPPPRHPTPPAPTPAERAGAASAVWPPGGRSFRPPVV
ncbi:OmpA family protein, partial [Streptomyces sp. WAC05950]